MKLFLCGAASVAALLMPCATIAATVTVSTPAQLQAAIQGASGGDIIRVAPGNYGNLDIARLNFASPVTIIASNSARKPVFSHLSVIDSSGLKISRLSIEGAAVTAAYPGLSAAEVKRSQNIRLSDMFFRGVASGGLSLQPRGIRLSASSKITVSGSTFTELSQGITTDNSSRLTLTDNAFSKIRINGIISDGASNSVILRNRFSEFRPEAGDHPDAIQLYATDYTTDILQISDNLIVGDAGGQMQGIFISNNVGDRNMLDRITIADNVLWGTMFNGIAAFDVDRISIVNDRVFSNDSLAVRKAWIRVAKANQAIVTGNYAGAHIFTDIINLTQESNVSNLSDAGALAAVAAWDLSHSAGARSSVYGGLAASISGAPTRATGESISQGSFLGSVPEPSSWTMLIGGVAVMGAVARRRRHVSQRLTAGVRAGLVYSRRAGSRRFASHSLY